MAKSVVLLWILLLVVLPASGCRQMVKQVFETPKVELADVALDSDPTRNLLSPWRFMVTLKVDNPNSYALNVARIAYSGMIGNEVVAEGESAEDIRIAPSGVTTVRAPISLKPGAFETAARQVLTKKSLSWEFDGSVGLRTPIGNVIRIPFSKTGSYDLFYILKRMGIGLN
jgi:LEA14-like dessication related protein